MEFDLIWFMIQPSPLKILKASAGSGKTFSLAIHYLTLLFSEDYKYREILAVTFTNKATEEMKTRILDVLRGIAQQDNSAEIESYRSILLASFPQYSPAHFQERADRIYRRIIHDYSRFSVSTIDGFVQKVIRSFSFELGLDSSYALEMNIDKVKNNLVERLELALDSNPALVNWIIRLAKERIDANKSWNYKSELLDLTSEIFKERFADFEQALTAIGLDKVDQTFQKLAKETKLAITQFEQQLVTYAEEVEKFITESQHVLNHEGLQELFAKAEQTLEEKGIIDSQGKQHRPDKILLCADELIILDYKFTLQAYQEHIDQVQLYKELCADMGYKNVKGYLFYAISKTLQIV